MSTNERPPARSGDEFCRQMSGEPKRNPNVLSVRKDQLAERVVRALAFLLITKKELAL